MLLQLPEELLSKVLRYVIEKGNSKDVADLALVHSAFQKALLSKLFWSGPLMDGAEVLLHSPNLYRRVLADNCTELTECPMSIVLANHFPSLQSLEVWTLLWTLWTLF